MTRNVFKRSSQLGCVMLAVMIVLSLTGFCNRNPACKRHYESPNHFYRCLPQCHPTKTFFDEGLLVLRNSGGFENQTLFVIRNISGRTVYLDHTDQNSDMSAGWGSHIGPHNVSAFILDKPSMPFTCSIKSRKGLMGPPYHCVPCHCVLSVCPIQTADMLVGTEGSYWVIENESNMSNFMGDIESKGIIIPVDYRHR
jgi:hypothetical protein